jgi:hypothetical protein
MIAVQPTFSFGLITPLQTILHQSRCHAKNCSCRTWRMQDVGFERSASFFLEFFFQTRALVKQIWCISNVLQDRAG